MPVGALGIVMQSDDTAFAGAAPEGNGHAVWGDERNPLRHQDAANLLLAAISTAPVIATGILAWQFVFDGQKLRGIVLLHLVPGRPEAMQ